MHSPAAVATARPFADGLHLFDRPFRMKGLEIGTRSTVVRLADGSLLVHSPVAFGEDLREALLRLGPVRHLVAPNKFHHLALPGWAAAYPGALLHGAPGQARKRPDLRFHAELGDAPHPAWASELDQLLVRGTFQYGEVVFLHRRSRTLIVADLLLGYGPEHPLLTRLVARIMGIYERWGWPRVGSLGEVGDPGALRASIDRILAWDFEGIVLSHGRIVEQGGREVLRRAYEWLKP
jgi:hypothetical protein